MITRKATAETQIAENAGMYKMCRRLFELIERITLAPEKLHLLREKGDVAIEVEEEDRIEPAEVSEDGK